MQTLKIAIIQNRPLYDLKSNLAEIEKLVKTASSQKADLILLPEISIYPYDLAKLPLIAQSAQDILETFCNLAKNISAYLCPGSLPIKEGDSLYNRSFLIDPSGQILEFYDKCHLFNVEIPTLNIQEADIFNAGNKLGLIKTPLANIGILICYDIRFPEMARTLTLAGAELILVPAAFNHITGPAHWHSVFRCRAIENQVFLAAASPAPTPSCSYQAYGHSLLVDPWGTIIAEANTEPEILFATLNASFLEETRVKMPLIKQRRKELYFNYFNT